jgi:hypothetical protein
VLTYSNSRRRRQRRRPLRSSPERRKEKGVPAASACARASEEAGEAEEGNVSRAPCRETLEEGGRKRPEEQERGGGD